ncbi:hypothetical protein BU17DRAFT_61902 [Hysterangium stoloniferum]|nr:hypothetical protein BU17DRAFT_61902 [Hysterangium stoloniferum]
MTRWHSLNLYFNSLQLFFYTSTTILVIINRSQMPLRGSYFLAHQGTEAPECFVKLYSLYGEFDNALTEDLRQYSETLLDQLSEYNAISHKYITKFYHEAYMTRLPDGTRHLMVPKGSAVVPGTVNAEPLMLNKDHLGLVKFGSYGDNDYLTVMRAIRSIISDINVC